MWGETALQSGSISKIIPLDEESFYTINHKGGLLLGSVVIHRYDNLEKKQTLKLQQVVNNAMANYVASSSIDGKLLVFLSQRDQNTNHLYAKVYNYLLHEEGSPVHLADYIEDKGKRKEEFVIIQSGSRSHFAIFWLLSSKKNEKDVVGFKVFNSALEELNYGEFELPFDPRFYDLENILVNDHGEFFIVVREYESERINRLGRNRDVQKAIHVFRPFHNKLIAYQLQSPGISIETVDLFSQDSLELVATGVYGEKNAGGVQGMFYLKLQYDNDTPTVVMEKYEQFGRDFITQDWTDRELDRAAKRLERGKPEPAFFNYIMRDAFYLEDGSITGSLEQFYVNEIISSDPRTGGSRTNYVYYYNDIIAYKILPDGTFAWLTKVPKEQVSTNDGGPFSSYYSYLENGHLNFVFNDHVFNYDDRGYFNETRVYTASFSRKKNVIAQTTIDIASGDQQRKVFFDRKELSTIVMPKKFVMDQHHQVVWMYALIRKKECFGRLQLAK